MATSSVPVNSFKGGHIDHQRGHPDHVLTFFVIIDLTFRFHLSGQEAFFVESLT